jgi:phosphate transport system substrate-binding protein
MNRVGVCLTLGLIAAAGSGVAALSVTGAGATFPYPIYSKWFNEYKKLHPDVEINYQSIGSGGGIKNVTDGTVDFGASDAIMTPQQLDEYKTKHGFEILAFPTVLGAVALTYNIPGVTGELNFTPEALAGMFLGKITKWNDGELEKANPGVKLPSTDIVIVHRAESSGTTFCWTDYLSKVSPEWKQKVGANAAVNWPVGLGAKGSEGVSGQVKQTPGSIGYVELTYALQNKLPYGKVKNSSGAFVKPDMAAVSAAAAGVEMPDDFRISITNASGKAAYPISTFTWLLIPSKISDPAKHKAIKDFLTWMLGPGQKLTEALDYAALPKQVVAKETKALTKIAQ